MNCQKAGVLRVKAEGKKDSADIILTLAPRVTAKQIVPLLAKNEKWKVSGSTLKIAQEDLGYRWPASRSSATGAVDHDESVAIDGSSQNGDWFEGLMRDVGFLVPKKKQKKTTSSD